MAGDNAAGVEVGGVSGDNAAGVEVGGVAGGNAAGVEVRGVAGGNAAGVEVGGVAGDNTAGVKVRGMAGDVALYVEVREVAGNFVAGVEVSDNVAKQNTPCCRGVAKDIATGVEMADDVGKRDTSCCHFLCLLISQFLGLKKHCLRGLTGVEVRRMAGDVAASWSRGQRGLRYIKDWVHLFVVNLFIMFVLTDFIHITISTIKLDKYIKYKNHVENENC